MELSGSPVAQQRVERLGHEVQERTRAAGHRGDTQTTCQQSHTGSRWFYSLSEFLPPFLFLSFSFSAVSSVQGLQALLI